jgi:hypothetical protein
MTSSKSPAGPADPTFPPHAQRVAKARILHNRSKTGRRSHLLATLASFGGTLVRVHPALSMFAASLIAFAPVHALAQDQQSSTSVRDRQREEYDPLGMRLGAFNLRASVDVVAESDDNIFAEEVGQDEDVIFSVAPNASLRSTWSRHAISFDAGARFESHEDFSSEDVDTGYARFGGRLDVGSRSNVALDAGLSHEREARTDSDAPTVGDPVEYDRSDLALTAEHTFNRFKVTGAVAYREYSFDSIVQSVRDNEQTSFRARVDAALTPRLGLVLQATTDERDYGNSATLSSEGTTLLAGVSMNFNDLLRGEITAGQFDRDYDGGASADGLAVAANLEWYPTGLTTVTFNARQNAEDVVGATSATPFTESQYGVRVDHELLRNVILTAGAQVGTREFEDPIDREDEVVGVEIGADYLMNRRIALRARYNFDDVQSSGADRYRDFEVNAFTLGVSFRL